MLHLARAAAVILAIALAGLPVGPTTTPSTAADPPPNVLVIVTDDQPKGTEDAMPTLLSEVAARGLTFTNGVTPTALCCPSRASFLTGNLAHTTGVYNISNGSHGGWRAFRDRGGEARTLATELDALGYRTGLFGKYLNGYNLGAPQGYVPPGWDVFRAIEANNGKDGAYYNYQLTGLSTAYGNTAAAYSTDVTGALATQFIDATPASTPFFVYYAPFGPHGPHTAAPRHWGTWPAETTAGIPAFNEADVSDKPAWVRDNPLVDAAAQTSRLRRQHMSLKSVDEQIANLLAAVGPRISNTVVVFLSDNGLMLGSHRITEKDVPYAAASEVPMYVRWDGHVTPGSTTDRVTPQIDLTALIRDAAGVPGWVMDGTDPLTTARDGVAFGQLSRDGHPAYCGWRTADHLYVKYSGSTDREFYDYVADPEELTNVVDVYAYAALVSEHHDQAVAHCSPTPPGFRW